MLFPLPARPKNKGDVYKRRDNLRGRFAYRKKYAVLRFSPPDAASRRRSSAGGGDGGGAEAAAAAGPPCPTLALMKGQGRSETQKVVSLEVGLSRCYAWIVWWSWGGSVLG